MRLSLTLYYNTRNNSDPSTDQIAKSFPDFLRSIKKGSHKFNKVLVHQSIITNIIADSVMVNTFCRNLNASIHHIPIIESVTGSWNVSFLLTDLREFIFLEQNNCVNPNRVWVRQIWLPKLWKGITYIELYLASLIWKINLFLTK
jgi:hypothetical protein